MSASRHEHAETSIVEETLARAAERQQREASRPRIDYDRMRRVHPKQKAALTRAVNSGNVEKVMLACRAAVREWDEIGAWPDDWSRWQRALDGVLPWNQPAQLEDLR